MRDRQREREEFITRMAPYVTPANVRQVALLFLAGSWLVEWIVGPSASTPGAPAPVATTGDITHG